MNLGMSELLVVGIVALIVIGPRDLPEMFRQLGRMSAKLRAMSREFSRAMEQAANEAGVKDVARDLKAMTDPKSMGLNAVKDAVDKFEKWDPIKNAAKPSAEQKTSTIRGPVLPEGSIPATPAPKSVENVAAEPVIGPNTKALYEKKAAREAIVKESAAKLKALETAVETPAEPKKAPRKKKKAAEE